MNILKPFFGQFLVSLETIRKRASIGFLWVVCVLSCLPPAKSEDTLYFNICKICKLDLYVNICKICKMDLYVNICVVVVVSAPRKSEDTTNSSFYISYLDLWFLLL